MISEQAIRLRKARGDKDLTQFDLARLSTVARSTIARFETQAAANRMRMQFRVAQKLASVLGVDAQWLMAAEDVAKGKGHRLLKAREDKDLTQHELARLSKVGRATIAAFEAGGTTRRMRLSIAEKLAAALGVKAEWLMAEGVAAAT